MRFTNYKAIKLATPPAGGVNPPTGNIFVWETVSGSTLVINWRDSTGTDRTFSGAGGAAAFTELTDVPAAYTGAGGYKVKVKADESGLEFVEDTATSDTIATITASGNWIVPAGVTLLKDIWIIGGGGAGASSIGSGLSGGGGAGGVLHLQGVYIESEQSLGAVIGAGGAGNDTIGLPGGNSTLTLNGVTYTGVGGGCGGHYIVPSSGSVNGGSGGGVCAGSTSVGDTTPGTGTAAAAGTYYYLPKQGNSGGIATGWNTTQQYAGGGGGGYSQVGADGVTNNPGDGGDGLDLSAIVGTLIGDSGWFAGGGGGGAYEPSNPSLVPSSGGQGGGGGGGDYSTFVGANGMANTGGGGGGASYMGTTGGNGGSGGSGIIIIRY